MRTVLLNRFESSDQGTLGRLIVGGQTVAVSMEPPWRNNRPNKSCIPNGEYHCVWHRSPKYGWVYWVSGVPGRGHILIHPGNVAGDSLKGFKTHSKGCLLLGRRAGWLWGQRAVLVSRPAVRRFFETMHHNDFMLVIKGDVCGI